MVLALLQMDSSSVPIAIGEPIGGGMFVSNVVLAAVILSAGGSVQVEKPAFFRDTGFYTGAILLITVVSWDGIVRSHCLQRQTVAPAAAAAWNVLADHTGQVPSVTSSICQEAIVFALVKLLTLFIGCFCRSL